MSGLLRQGHFLGTKLKTLRKRNGLTLDELSARCVQLDAGAAPSVSYLSMIENGKRMPSAELLDMLARLFGKEARWFLDENTAVEPVPARRERGGLEAMPLEPAFLFSHELLQNALPELLSQTGTSGRQFAQLLIRVWQETHHNDFPDIERAAESVGRRELPLSLDRLHGHLQAPRLACPLVRSGARRGRGRPLRARFEAPDTVLINRNLRDQEERLALRAGVFHWPSAVAQRRWPGLGARGQLVVGCGTAGGRRRAAAAWARRTCSTPGAISSAVFSPARCCARACRSGAFWCAKRIACPPAASWA